MLEKKTKTYQRVASEIATRITLGEYGPGSPLPAERVLESEFSVHRATVRRALGVLSDQGLLSRTPGSRAIVTGGSSLGCDLAVLSGFPDEPFARLLMLEGIQRGIEGRDARLNAFAAPATDLDSFLDRQTLRGMVLLPPSTVDLDRLRAFRKSRPVVVVDRMIPGFECDFVGFEDFQAGYAAAKHLYEMGHRHIAFLGSEIPATALDRCRGVEAFCIDAGLPPSWNFSGLASGRPAPEGFLEAIFDLARKSWPTAAVCTNDETAAHVIVALARVGLRVPDDLALVGFGNVHSALLQALDLTTMAQPYNEVGREASSLILGRTQGSAAGDPRTIRLPMQLVKRGSCGSGASD